MRKLTGGELLKVYGGAGACGVTCPCGYTTAMQCHCAACPPAPGGGGSKGGSKGGSRAKGSKGKGSKGHGS